MKTLLYLGIIQLALLAHAAAATTCPWGPVSGYLSPSVTFPVHLSTTDPGLPNSANFHLLFNIPANTCTEPDPICTGGFITNVSFTVLYSDPNGESNTLTLTTLGSGGPWGQVFSGITIHDAPNIPIPCSGSTYDWFFSLGVTLPANGQGDIDILSITATMDGYYNCIPEPSSLCLISIASGACLLRRNRKHR